MMHEVKIKKQEALEIIEKNRDEHKAIFAEGTRGYNKELRKILTEKIEALDNGEEVTPTINLHRPCSHEEEYNLAIKMLELSVDAEIVLDSTQFRQLIMDKWHWQKDFLRETAKFSMLARQKLDG
jgi:hypothetical protein